MGVLCDSFSFFDGVTPLNQTNWANYWRNVVPDCVVAGIADELKVFGASLGMKVKIKPGEAIVDNHRAFIVSEKELDIPESDPDLTRIDAVVLRVNYRDSGLSDMELDILSGEPSDAPETPALTQTTGAVYEMALAYVTVGAGVLTIAAEDVTDARPVYDASGEKGMTFLNGDEETLRVGHVVQFGLGAQSVVRWSTYGTAVGVCTTDALPGEPVKVQTKPGVVAEVMCTLPAVFTGDALVRGDVGMCERGGAATTIGVALESKAADSVANVKALLTIYATLPWQNVWYMPTGLTEDKVIAAYAFIHSRSETDALKMMNQGAATYNLSKTSNVTWAESVGFKIPAAANSGLKNTALLTGLSACKCAVIRFSGVSTTANTVMGGVALGGVKFLYLKNGHTQISSAEGAEYYKHMGINTTSLTAGGFSTQYYRSAVSSGVVAAQGTAMYLNGAAQSLYTRSGDGSMRANAIVPKQPTGGMVLGNFSATGADPFTIYTMNSGAWNIQAAVFFNVNLSAAQQVEIYESMKGL